MAGDSKETIKLNLKVWRQDSADAKGAFQEFTLDEVSVHMSFLEMLDVLNEKISKEGQEPVAFDHDCREGICGMCSLVINGRPHGPEYGTTACQLHMRSFKNGDTISIEPFRASAFPVVRDLVVDRTAFDRIIQAGGYISVRTNSVPDANTLPVAPEDAVAAFDAAACIGCGACVATCKNASAMLFTSAKVSQLNRLPQGKVEAEDRVVSMVNQMGLEGFGNCTNEGECSAVCPKEIGQEHIARLNREYLKAVVKGKS